jgi:hypothetical protein
MVNWTIPFVRRSVYLLDLVEQSILVDAFARNGDLASPRPRWHQMRSAGAREKSTFPRRKSDRTVPAIFDRGLKPWLENLASRGSCWEE